MGCHLVDTLPSEIHLSILTYLRAIDLSAIQRTCHFFNNRTLISDVIHHTATVVYPPDLTDGFDTPIISGEVAVTMNQKYLTYECLRNMEMLVVARVLSRPEPSLLHGEAGFYVSKSWCRTALRWLEVQQEERREREQESLALQSHHHHHHHHGGKKKKSKKLSKKQQRLRNRKLSDALPPWPNVNDDILCEHTQLRHCSSKSARARRRVMDKQAWKILKKLYPDSVQLESKMGECIECALEKETSERRDLAIKEKEKQERKRPLSCAKVRAFYTRSRGVPIHCLVPSNSDDDDNNGNLKKLAFDDDDTITSTCPLVPGIYHALPRSWCHGWRKYLKTGEGDPTPPDASACLCDAHKLPLVPPHLNAFLHGKTNALLSSIGSVYAEEGGGGGGYGMMMESLGSCSFVSSSPVAASAAVGTASFATPTKGGVVTPFSSSSSVAFSPSSHSKMSPLERFKSDHNDDIDKDNDDDDAEKDQTKSNNNNNNNKMSKKEQQDMMDALRAAGFSEAEVQSQRLAMMNLEETNKMRQKHHYHHYTSPVVGSAAAAATVSPSAATPFGHGVASVATLYSPSTPSSSSQQQQQQQQVTESVNERLDKENRVVVEILTDEEFVALERWWPEIHSNYALRFAITTDGSGRADVAWSTMPCRDCDATGRIHSVTMRKRSKRWDKKR